MNGFFLLVGCIILSALASVFLKIGATSFEGSFNFLNLITNQMIWIGAFFYAGAFLGYIYVLRIIPLSLAQPVITVGVSAITVLIATIVFREHMMLLNWLGFALICVGVSLLFWGRV